MSDSAPLEADTIVVVPCYNESRRLDTRGVMDFLSIEPRVRFLFIDDSSTDTTTAVLETLCARSPDRLRWIKLERNSGKGEAVRRGVLAALLEKPSFIGYWDADFSTPLSAIGDFLAVLGAEDSRVGVLGSRVRRLGAHVDRDPLRHYMGRVFATLASLVLGIAVYDTQCGAKMFRATDEVARAFAEPFLGPWVFDVEVLARLRNSIAPAPLADYLFELPLASWRDVAGSKLTTSHRVAAISDLFRIWRTYR